MTVLIFPWGARCGEQVLCAGKRQCLCQQGCSAPPTALSAAQDGPFWDGLHPRPACQLCPVRMPSRLHLLRGERLMCCSKPEDFMASGWWLSASSAFSREAENAPVSCGFWPKDGFPWSVPGGVKSISHEEQSHSCFTGDGGTVKQGFYLRAHSGPHHFLFCSSSPKNRPYFNLDCS